MQHIPAVYAYLRKPQECEYKCEDNILLNSCDKALTITFQASSTSVHI